MTRCVAYIRTSTDRQDLSLEAQESKVRAMAAVKDGTLLEVIRDADESGKDLDRPGARKLMEMVKGRSVDMVIIAKLDRLTRSVRDLAEIVEVFRRKRVTLVSVSETIDTGTASGRMFLNILGLMAQWEREIISERTSVVLQQKRKRGEVAGNIPYGFRREGDKLVEDEQEQIALREMKHYRDQGMGLRKVADALNEQGLRTRRGTPWRFQYVANLLEQ